MDINLDQKLSKVMTALLGFHEASDIITYLYWIHRRIWWGAATPIEVLNECLLGKNGGLLGQKILFIILNRVIRASLAVG